MTNVAEAANEQLVHCWRDDSCVRDGRTRSGALDGGTKIDSPKMGHPRCHRFLRYAFIRSSELLARLVWRVWMDAPVHSI